MTETSDTTTTAYRHGTWVLSADQKVRACFDYIGEGISGEYDESDPSDVALLRLDVNVVADLSDTVDGEPVDDDGWVYPACGSICTMVPMEGATEGQMVALLSYAADTVADAIGSGTDSVKGAMDRLSLLPTLR